MQVKKQQLEPDNRLVPNWERSCILSPSLFNLYAEIIMRNARLNESQARIKSARRNIKKTQICRWSSKQDKPKAKHPKTHINQIDKEQILKAAWEKQQITHKGIPIRITADLSIETLQARREGQDILKVMKENNL